MANSTYPIFYPLRIDFGLFFHAIGLNWQNMIYQMKKSIRIVGSKPNICYIFSQIYFTIMVFIIKSFLQYTRSRVFQIEDWFEIYILHSPFTDIIKG